MDMTAEQARIRRWLGIANRIGTDMTYWILSDSGRVIARSTVQRVTQTDIGSDTIRNRLAEYDASIATRLNDEHHFNDDHHVFYLQDDPSDDDPTGTIPPPAEEGDMLQPDRPKWTTWKWKPMISI